MALPAVDFSLEFTLVELKLGQVELPEVAAPFPGRVIAMTFIAHLCSGCEVDPMLGAPVCLFVVFRYNKAVAGAASIDYLDSRYTDCFTGRNSLALRKFPGGSARGRRRVINNIANHIAAQAG